jgi:hypothetical protein
MTIQETIKKLPSYVRITGSYARQEQTAQSDLDFYVPERYWSHFKKWAEKNMEGKPSSPMVGALTWYIPTMMEFSDLFMKQNCKEKSIVLYGRTFKTW